MAARGAAPRRPPGDPEVTHNSTIARWLDRLGAWWRDDETPWCGAFVGHCLGELGYNVPDAWYRALAWADWGTAIEEPRVGCIVVFRRKGGGHVGFVVGVDETGRC